MDLIEFEDFCGTMGDLFETRGVNNLITDKPALARSVIQQRSQMNSLERLLLELAGLFGVTPELGEQ